MGFKSKNNSGGKVFVTPSKGRLVIRCDKDEDGAVARTLEKGKNAGTEIWELHFPGYEGMLRSAYIEEGEAYGDKIVLEMEDTKASKNDKYRKVSISFGIDSSYAPRFIDRCRNIDLKEPLLFEPYSFTSKDDPSKTIMGMNLYQGDGDKPLAATLAKEDHPEWVKKKTRKGTEWDKTDFLEFMVNHFNDWVEENNLDKKESSKDSSNDDEEEEEEAPKKKSFGRSKSSGKQAPADEDGDDIEF